MNTSGYKHLYIFGISMGLLWIALSWQVHVFYYNKILSMSLGSQSILDAYSYARSTFELLLIITGSGSIGYFLHWVRSSEQMMRVSQTRQPKSSVTHRSTVDVIDDATHTNEARIAKIQPQISSTLANQINKHVESQTIDDLQIIDGIGPKSKKALNAQGIYTFADLAKLTQRQLRQIMDNAGEHFKIVATDTWGYQASLARDGKFTELKEYKDFLINGREPVSE